MRNRLSIQGIGMLLAITTVFTFNLKAQEGGKYSEQIEAYKQCFTDKSGDKIKPFLAADISFPPVPQDRLAELMDRLLQEIFSSPLLSLEVKSIQPGEVVMVHDYGDFQKLGRRESTIFFNEEGKITRIEEIEAIIRIASERRQNELPQPNEALAAKYPAQKVTFKTPNNDTVVGELYEANVDAPVILLCHQLGWNKFEYAGIAPVLNEMGFNALAVDLTGGGSFGNRSNETVESRGEFDREKLLDYAEEELAASIDFLKNKYGKKVTVWGSSYSATLVILAAEKNKDINASISFSAFNHFGERRPALESIIPKIKKPMFMTSAKAESKIIDEILVDIKLRKKQYHFTPKESGEHGSKALWTIKDDHEEYWVEIRKFLTEVYPNR